MSDFEKYYLEQAGSGIAFYPGIRYQKGHGVLGRLFGRVLPAVLPILKSIGRTVLGTGLDVADDVVSGKSDFQTSIKTRGAAAAQNTARELISKGREKLAQSGTGSRRRKRTSRKMPLFTIKAGGALSTRKRRRKTRKTTATKVTRRAVKSKKRKSKSAKTRKPRRKGRKRSSTSRKKTAAAGKASNLPPYLSY